MIPCQPVNKLIVLKHRGHYYRGFTILTLNCKDRQSFTDYRVCFYRE